MHKFLLLSTVALSMVAALALGSSAAFAQQTPPPQHEDSGQSGLGVQIVGGPLFSNLADAEGLHTANRAGYLVGISLGGNRGGRVGIGADVLYGKKSAEVNGSNFDQNVVHVPVMLKVNVGSTNRNGLSVFGLAGGFFDWQFSSKLANVDISKDTDGFEVGYVAGVGFEVLRFSVQGRYIRGLREINKTFTVAQSTEVKTQSFLVLLGFRLN